MEEGMLTVLAPSPPVNEKKNSKRTWHNYKTLVFKSSNYVDFLEGQRLRKGGRRRRSDMGLGNDGVTGGYGETRDRCSDWAQTYLY